MKRGKVVRVADNEGRFSGLAASVGNVDAQGDIIEAGAFDRTVKDRPVVPLLANHDYTRVVGVGRLSVGARGLMVAGRLNLETAAGSEAMSNLTLGGQVLGGLSIGFTTRDFRTERDGVRRLLDVEVHEVSITPFPANDRARVVSVGGRAAEAMSAARVRSPSVDDHEAVNRLLREMSDWARREARRR